jgi:hypothetical protein
MALTEIKVVLLANGSVSTGRGDDFCLTQLH